MTPQFSSSALTLSIDCSQPSLALGLGSAASTVATRQKNVLQSTENLVSEIDALLKSQTLERAQLQQLVVSVGPGSFTGIRSAIAAALGIAAGAAIPLFAVSTLTAKTLAALKPQFDFAVGVLELNASEFAITVLGRRDSRTQEILAPQLITKTSFEALKSSHDFAPLSAELGRIADAKIGFADGVENGPADLLAAASAGFIRPLEPLYLKPVNALTLEQRGLNPR